MGTSTPFGGAGPGSPLIPTWLDDGAAAPAPPAPGGTAPDSSPPAGLPLPPPDRPPVAKPHDDNRFRGARSSFTRFASSGGSDRANLGRAVSRYVSRSAGGAANAARRMGASRTSGASLFGFLSDVQARGANQALLALNLHGLAGRPIQEIFLELVDYICPNGGTLDEAIAREAFIETIVDLADLGLTDLDALTADQLKAVFELYVTNSIEARLCNDIAMSLVQIPTSVDATNNIQEQVHDFIQRGVADALATVSLEGQDLTPARVREVVTSVYESSFAVLKAMGEEEASQ
ncbi:MAG TPA: Qat anti-phage system associated protein QatB [Usitatibacter sp.]|nr:Qat anti-phage system associated protein QatB [Usitatibacter sp.]